MAESRPVRISVVGGGMIGRQHVTRILAVPEAALASVVDPSEPGRALAAEAGVACFGNIGTMLQADRPDAVIVATPNQLHLAHGLEVVAAGLPLIVEKPLADELEGARRLVEAAERANVPLIVGHHRRHNPRLLAVKQAIDGGRIGRVVAAHAMCWFHKPASYFDAHWRRQPGAGPVLVNLIHDIDLLRYFCGEVEAVQAMQSDSVRGFAVEDTAALLVRFRGGVLGTVAVSDTIASPWSWEFTSGENPAYSHTPEACYMIGGTLGSMTIPTLALWSQQGTPDWMKPIGCEQIVAQNEDPLVMQVRNLCDVVRGRAAPVVPGREGLETLRVVLAAKQAAASGCAVRL